MSETKASGTHSRMRLFAFSTILVLMAVTFSLIVAEVMVRIVAPQQLILIRPDLWKPADTVGWLHQANAKASINTGEGHVNVITDEEGFRIGSAGRARSGWPVLVLGDSFMEALQVDYEESFPGLLQKRLPGMAGSPVAIRNAGVGGWDPNQYLMHARAAMARENYRLVVVSLYIGNDILDERVDYVAPRKPTKRNHFRIPRGLSWNELVISVLKPMNDFLEVRSHLFVLARSRLDTLRMRSGLHPLPFPVAFRPDKASGIPWSLTADVCEEIRDLAKSYGAETLFVFIPSPIQVDPEEFDHFVRGFNIDPQAVDLYQPNQRLMAEFSQRGLRVVDPLKQLQDADKAGKKLYGTVDRHFTAAGHEVLADVVTPVVAEMLNSKDSALTSAASLR